MSVLNTFELKPLSAMMKVPTITFCLFAAVHGQAQAVQLIGAQRTIDATTQSTDWQLLTQSTLNMNSATATSIDLMNSTLNMNRGSVANDIRAAAGSTVNINSARVSSNNTVFGAVRLENSTAVVNNSTVTNSAGVGLQALGTIGAPGGSSATVTNSVISGAVGGAEATSGSELHFNQNTRVQGTGAGAFGLSLSGATATASQSSIVGNGNGVSFTRGRFDTTDGKLVLDQSSVEGVIGSAISVRGTPGRAPAVEIDVLNGSTLKGGNGNLLSVSGGGSATMNVDNSRLTGNVIADATSTANLSLQNNAALTGQLQNVSSLNVGNASNWTMTGDSQVGALNMAGGTVTMGAPDAFYQLNLKTLAGNGTFVMGTDFAQGKTDFINVTGDATGNHSLLLAASGAEAVNPDQIRVVHTGGGDAEFSLVGGKVDSGAYSYGLKQAGTDWYLDPATRVVSRSAQVVRALANTPVTVMYGEEASLRARMGEVRFEPGLAGLWIRGFGSKYDVSKSSGTGYTQNQRGFSIGADMPLGDSQWLVGAAVGHSTSDLSVAQGASGSVKSYFASLYATWKDQESGLYFDAVAKANRFQNGAKVTLSDSTTTKGDYNNVGGGISAEFGRHIKLGEEGTYIEPYGRLSTIVVQGGNYNLKNGLKVDGERTRSRMAEVGATIGHDFQLDDGTIVQPYLKAAMVHEFANNNKVAVNGQTFNNDLSGSRSKLGAGVAVKFSPNLQMHVDLETSNSNKIDQVFGANVGVRYAF
ncbi:autotransporter outer membrane beta-barrel domain-containing protein [Pseudomonas costantinii]|uniref:autotransporter outer membrane beta-barrel domain-containing protein n=1 Tax=Pseudomonas costantinii TaxID=168469 RepID=UPI0015A2D358|nr:autotransporter outer membrane beta-barrel domain-containing protein [Pseudomonas costantinii]NVZ71274.1 autotransporter outer membrane beta-barrel domain-containing protein [Pseudomonas costantinii]